MFYSQIILAKKGPLGRVWQAAHWGEKKISRPQIFNTDIAASVESIVHPTVPLALRVSGHLLLGVVRIYSRQVKYCLTDCHEAMVKIKMAFRKDKKGAGNNIDMVMIDPAKRDSGATTSAHHHNNNLNVANFGEYQDFLLDPNALIVDDDGDATGFAIPIDLNQMSDHELAERWVLAEQSFHDDSQETAGNAATANGDSQANTSLESSNNEWSQFATQNSQAQPEEQWRPFDPDAEDLDVPKPATGGEEEEEEEDDPMPLPDDNDEEDEQEPVMMDEDEEPTAGGRVSEIEVARAADDSMLSENPELRVSIQGDEVMDMYAKRNAGPVTPGGMSEASFPIPADDGTDLGQIPMPEGDDEQESPTLDGGVEVSGLNELSFSRDSVTGAAAVGGLDESADIDAPAQPTDEDSEESDEAPKPKKRKKQEGPKRRRTRRKVVIDNDATELEGDHIKAMLQDTSDITLAHVPHPADWSGGGGRHQDDGASVMSHSQADLHSLATYAEESYYSGTQTMPTQDTARTMATQMTVPSGIAGAVGQEDRLILDHMSFEELLLRPCLGDDGQLAPELLQLWRDNLAAVEGKPSPYPKRSSEDDEDEDEDEEEAEEEEVEVARGGEEEKENDEEVTLDADGNPVQPSSEDPTQELVTQQLDDDEPMPLPDDDEGPMPLPEDDEHENAGGLNMGSDDEAPPLPFDDEEDETLVAKTSDDEKSAGSQGGDQGEGENKFGLSDWGMVNDATEGKGGGASDDEDGEDEDDPRQEAGTELVSSTTKWHRHTVRVLKVLQRTMGDMGGKQDMDGNDKPESIIFGEMVKSCSRRTAAGCFFEILQLKTWDYVSVDQHEAEGDIILSPGVKFTENPPSN